MKRAPGSQFFNALANRVADLAEQSWAPELKRLRALEELVKKSHLMQCSNCEALREGSAYTCDVCEITFCSECYDDLIEQCPSCRHDVCNQCKDWTQDVCNECINNQEAVCHAKGCEMEMYGKMDYCSDCGEHPVCVEHKVCKDCE